MHNLGETRSRQFHRHSTIEPIVRTTSFHTLEDSRKNGRNKNFMRTPYAENNYDSDPQKRQTLGSQGGQT